MVLLFPLPALRGTEFGFSQQQQKQEKEKEEKKERRRERKEERKERRKLLLGHMTLTP